MDRRSNYARRFGPKKDEATYLYFLKQINILRVEQGMPEITAEQFLDTNINDESHLPDYDWMDDGF